LLWLSEPLNALGYLDSDSGLLCGPRSTKPDVSLLQTEPNSANLRRADKACSHVMWGSSEYHMWLTLARRLGPWGRMLHEWMDEFSFIHTEPSSP
jgi:hypothetical protein